MVGLAERDRIHVHRGRRRALARVEPPLRCTARSTREKLRRRCGEESITAPTLPGNARDAAMIGAVGPATRAVRLSGEWMPLTSIPPA